MVFGEIWHVHCRPLVILQKCYGEIWHAHFRTFPTGPTSEFRHGKNSSPHRQTIPVVPAPRDRQEWDFRYFQILVKRSREPTSATRITSLRRPSHSNLLATLPLSMLTTGYEDINKRNQRTRMQSRKTRL